MECYESLRNVYPGLRLILVPRHFERRAEVVSDAEALGLTLASWSEKKESHWGQADVLMVDTTGELKHFTGFADMVFVGKSLFRKEGQNPLEAANAGKFVVTGPGMNNFRRILNDLQEAKGVLQVESVEDLCSTLRGALENPEKAQAQGFRAEAWVQRCKGSLKRSVDSFWKRF